MRRALQISRCQERAGLPDRDSDSPIHKVPARPRHPSSTRVDMGLRSFHSPNASLCHHEHDFSGRWIGFDVQSDEDEQARGANEDRKGHETSYRLQSDWVAPGHRRAITH